MNRSQLYVLSATVGFSFILIFSTLLKREGVSSFEQLFLRLVFSLFILLFALLSTRRLLLAKRRDIPFFTAIGFTYAVFALSGLSAIAFGTPIAVSVSLVYTQPLFTALISFLTRKEKVTVLKTAIVLLGVAGAFLVSGLNAANPQIGLGIFFPVFAGFLYAVYLWLKRRAPTNEYSPFQVLFNTFLFAAPLLLVVWVVIRNFSSEPLFTGFIQPSATHLLLLFFFGLFCTVLPYGLLNYVKPDEISPTTEGVLLLGDPLMHALWAMVFFGEHVSMVQYVGAALILVSAALNLKLTTKTAR